METYGEGEWKQSYPRYYMEVSGQFHAMVPLPQGKNLPIFNEGEATWVPQSVWTLWRIEK
jgi:hypothetical protein